MSRKTKRENSNPVQLPNETSEMMELAARVAYDDSSARALIEIVNRLIRAKDFATRDRLAMEVVQGAYLMTSNISGAIQQFCESVDPFPAKTPPTSLRLVAPVA